MRLLRTPVEAAGWLRQQVRGTLRTDSRALQAGDGFLAWPGARTDARQHVAQALATGTGACLVEAQGAEAFGFADDDRVAAYAGLKTDAALVAAEFFGHPSQQLDLLAVTGTNGKTSTAWWLAQAFSALPQPLACAMVGTLGVGQPPAAGADADAVAPELLATGLTTPDAVLLQASLRRFVDGGLRACAMEASSIGICEHRLDGTRIHTAIFTNFTQDHLDYHGSMAAYWQAKQRLFAWPGLRAAVVNLDDPQSAVLLQSLDAALDVWTVSCTQAARLRAEDLHHTERGLAFTVVEGNTRALLCTGLIGQYNVSNLLGVLATLRAHGVPLADAVAVCHRLLPVPGRMQCVAEPGQPLVAVDYAHTPDALDKAIAALRPVTQQRGGRLWCVFGCGGDRDPAKRAPMGRAAAAADQVIVTSDNPRSEAPQSIIDQILPGLQGHAAVSAEVDRARAIAQALSAAAPTDVVLVAGKGHEAYQEVAGVRRPFSDLEQVRAALAQRHPVEVAA